MSLTGFLVVAVALASCHGQEKWVWDQNERSATRSHVAKPLLASKDASRKPLFLSNDDSSSLASVVNKNARYAVFEDVNENRPPPNFPNRPGGRPQDFGGQAQDFGGRPQDFGGRPQDFGGRPQDFGERPQDFEGRPQDFGGRPQDFGGRPQDFGGRPQDFGGRPQDFGGRPGLEGGLLRPGLEGTGPRPGLDGRPGFLPDLGDGRPPLGPDGGDGRPLPGRGSRGPGILTGPVPSWQRPPPFPNNDPTSFDTCKCTHSFNCKTPGIQFGSCDNGKQYCCYNSPKYGLSDRVPQGYGNKFGLGEKRPAVLVGPPAGHTLQPDFPPQPRLDARSADKITTRI